MLQQAKNEVQECIKTFKTDSGKCADKRAWFLLYERLGEDLCKILERYKDSELECYVKSVIDAVFAPTDLTS